MKRPLLLFCLFLTSNLVSHTAPDNERESCACQKIKALVALPQQRDPQPIEWTPFIDNLLILLQGLPEYKDLCEDLKDIRTPPGFRTLKLIWIAKKLNNHQEIFKKICKREEPLTFAEGRQIAKYIRF